MAEVITVELRQSSKFMKEYANPKFAEFLRTASPASSPRARRAGELRPDIDPAADRRARCSARSTRSRSPGLSKQPGSKASIDLVRAAEGSATLFIDGLKAR